jgi:Replication-relaxation
MSGLSSQHDRGHPIAHPVALRNELPLTSINGRIGAPNDGAHAGTIPSHRSRKQRTQPYDIEALRDRLSERDVAILRSVAQHQFLTVQHVEALHFADHAPISGARIARRTLARLREVRLLGVLTRRIGGVRAGSTGMVHYVDVVGRQLLEGRSGRHLRGFREPSQRFLSHRLAIADTHVALVQADQQGRVDLVTGAVEPASWRRFTGLGGARLTLKADLYAETATASDSELVHAWFIEIDLGSETIPTLLKKCRDYEAYRQTGIEQEREASFPFVVWSVTHTDPSKAQQRRLALRDAINSDRSLPNELFRVIAPEQVVPLLLGGAR